jgi:predicted HTH transcriptional regulator
LALSFVGVYLVATIGLTVVLKIVPNLSTYAPALFPLLALTGAAQLVLRAQHVQRMADKDKACSKEKDDREQETPAPFAPEEHIPVEIASIPAPILAPSLTAEQRRERLLALWAQGEGTSFATVAPDLGVSRQTISNDFAVLAQRGKVRRNGKGIEVIAVPEGDL